MKKFLSAFKQKKTSPTIWIIIALLIIAGLIISLTLVKDRDEKNIIKPGKSISVEEAKEVATNFINTYLMQPGSEAIVKDVVTEYGLYKLSIDVTSDLVESYLTKDGRLFFPQALDIKEIEEYVMNNNSSASQTPSATVTTKNDKPVVELFVMSYCPYSIQIEKGLLSVLETLGDKIDFQLKFCNYAMHGEQELQENLIQYCVQKEAPTKLGAYLNCFLEAGETSACLSEAKINEKTINNCVAKTDKEFKVTANFKNQVDYQGNFPSFNVHKDDNLKYSVGGSPTLIINGENIQSNRDSASLLTTICSAFNEQPAECQTALSSASPSAGFGFGTSSNSANYDCN